MTLDLNRYCECGHGVRDHRTGVTSPARPVPLATRHVVPVSNNGKPLRPSGRRELRMPWPEPRCQCSLAPALPNETRRRTRVVRSAQDCVRRLSGGLAREPGSGYAEILVVRRLWPVGPFVLLAQTSSVRPSVPCSRRSAYCGRGGGTAPLLASNAPRATATNGGPRLVPVEASRWRGPDVPTMIHAEEPRGKSSPRSLTNRADLPPETGSQPARVRYDTIRLRGRVGGHHLTNRRRSEHLDRLTGEVSLRSSSGYEVLPTSGVAVLADDRYGPYASFEMSVPKVLRGSNLVAASVPEVKRVVRAVHAEAAAVVDWLDDWPELEVRRIDLVRDVHGVHGIAEILDRLAVVPQARGRHRRRYTDATRGHAQSLTVGTPGRWQATAYDKGAERLHAARRARTPWADPNGSPEASAAHGQMRIEIGVRAAPLQERLKSTQLSNILKEDLMTATAEHYFNRARFGTAVGGQAKLAVAFRQMSQHPEERRKIDRLLGMLVLGSSGLPQTASENTINEHMALARKYGLTAADLTVSDRSTVRLDWNSASVCEVAA